MEENLPDIRKIKKMIKTIYAYYDHVVKSNYEVKKYNQFYIEGYDIYGNIDFSYKIIKNNKWRLDYIQSSIIW